MTCILTVRGALQVNLASSFDLATIIRKGLLFCEQKRSKKNFINFSLCWWDGLGLVDLVSWLAEDFVAGGMIG
jgi:hypothetical protein